MTKDSQWLLTARGLQKVLFNQKFNQDATSAICIVYKTLELKGWSSEAPTLVFLLLKPWYRRDPRSTIANLIALKMASPTMQSVWTDTLCASNERRSKFGTWQNLGGWFLARSGQPIRWPNSEFADDLSYSVTGREQFTSTRGRTPNSPFPHWQPSVL